MTNVDVACLAAELASLLSGSRIEKAFQPAKDQVVLRLRQKGAGRLDLLFELGRFLTITRRPPDNPDKPSMVAQILRSEYGNGRVVGVHQVGFDRLLRFDVERGDGRKAIVFELFGDGNLLLLDADDAIRLPMRGADHGARKLRKGEPYAPPPGPATPFDLDLGAFTAKGQAGVKDVVRFLAVDLGFGPQWAEELCARADVPKNTLVADVDDAQWQALHEQLMDLGDQIGRNDLAPVVIHKGEERVDAAPFPLVTCPAPDFAAEESSTFHGALDTYFVGTSDEDDAGDDPRQRRFDEAKGKLTRRIQQMQDSIDAFVADETARRQEADVLYLRFQEVQGLLGVILDAHGKGHSWQEIGGRLRQAADGGDVTAAMLADLRADATATLRLTDLDGQEFLVNVDVRRNVQENADRLYAESKKAAGRQDGAKVALKKSQAELAELEAKGLDGFGAAPKRKQEQSRHFWFESYRYCMGPDGALLVGGRNAAQNDAVVKKYLRDGDRYVHAAIHGAPSIVVRTPEDADAPSDADLEVAGQFAVCASRAWRQFGAASAYWVTPQQVNKTPRSGEFVPRGAWIVHGKRNTMDGLPMTWAVGQVSFTLDGTPVPATDAADRKTITKLVGGPPQAFAPYTDELVRMEPGDVEPNDAAAFLAERFECGIEEAQAVLPGGPVRWEGIQ